MDRSRVLVALAMALYGLSLVERTPGAAFVPTAAAESGGAPALLRGSLAVQLPGTTSTGAAAPAGIASAQGLRSTAGLLIGAAVVAAAWDKAGAARRRAASSGQPRVQRCADDSMLRPHGPIVAYAKALGDAAEKKKESVPVTKDVMKLKTAFDDEEFLNKLFLEVNEPYLSPLEKVALMQRLLGVKLESTVMPAFLRFVAKRQRLMSLKRILNDYIQNIYYNQSIIPVKCVSADPLSDKHKAAIVEKMKKRLGCSDVKLICTTDPSLLGGFKLEYGFTDPDSLKFSSDGQDVTLRGFLEGEAIKKGVIVSDTL